MSSQAPKESRTVLGQHVVGVLGQGASAPRLDRSRDPAERKSELVGNNSFQPINGSDEPEWEKLPPSDKAPLLGARAGVMRSGGLSWLTRELPPRLDCAPANHTIYRFYSHSATGSNCNVGDLSAVIGVLASSSTNAYLIASAFRIKSLTVWPAAIAAGSAVSTTSVVWLQGVSGLVKDDVFDGSVPAGVTVTRARRYTPPKGSLCSFWISSSVAAGNSLFTLLSPEGSIVDLEMEWVLSNGLSQFPFITTTGMSAGILYYGGLDNPLASGANYTPLGRPVIP